MAGYMTYWSKEHIKDLEKTKDKGPLSVIFGSHHTKMPSISSVKVGDVIYPITLANGTLCVVARLPVERIEVAFDYLVRETGQIHSALLPNGYAVEHTYNKGGNFYMTNADTYEKKEDLPEGTILLVPKKMLALPHNAHQEPQTCCAAKAASGTRGSTIELRPLPIEKLAELKFGPNKSKEKALKLDKNGVPTIVSLSGFVRRMSEETQEIFEEAFQEA